MKTERTHWGVLALIAFIALLLGASILLPPIRTVRVRAQRVQAVNNIAPVFVMQQSTSPAPAAPTKK
jgi:hypothetical protein